MDHVEARRSRRSLLLGVAGGVGGAVAATIAGAGRVLAAGSDGATVTIGGDYLDVRSETAFQNVNNGASVMSMFSSGTNATLDVVNNGGDAIHGFGTQRAGVKGTTGSTAGFGVVGQGPYVAIKGVSLATGASNGSGVGVFGTSASSDGAGVDGRSPNVGVHGQSDGTGVQGDGTNGGTGVYGTGKSGGIGVLGNSDTGRAIVGVASASTGPTVGVMGESLSSTGTGVRGWGAGNGIGVYGFSGGTFPTHNLPRNTGIFGNAPAGRGGLFAGGKAQIRLVPSQSAIHPHAGAVGDLFLDAQHRLWLCKGGTDWKRLG